MVTGVGYTGAWTSDSAGNLGFLYTVPDASWRHERIRAHRLGTRPDEDRDVLVEPDRRFEVTVRRCRSEQAIVLLSESRDTSECWWVDPTGADLAPRSLGGRRSGVSYRAEHVRGPMVGGTSCSSPTTTPSSSGWSPARCPGRTARTTRPGARSAPRCPASGSSAWTPSPVTS